MTIKNCPRCRTAVRVPDDKGQLLVTCRCGRRWYHPPGWVETSVLDFKCSVTGQPFLVRLTRRDPDARFTVEDYAVLDQPAENGPSRSTHEPGPFVLSLTGAKSVLALPGPVGASVRGWLVEVASRFVGKAAAPEPRPAEVRADSGASHETSFIPRKAEEYDFTGFTCPCCKDHQIVLRCRCGSFGCQGTAEERPGGRFWQCSCGWSGFLKGSGGEVLERKRLPHLLTARECHPELAGPDVRRLRPPSRRLPPPNSPTAR